MNWDTVGEPATWTEEYTTPGAFHILPVSHPSGVLVTIRVDRTLPGHVALARRIADRVKMEPVP